MNYLYWGIGIVIIVVILYPQRQAHHAETKTGADDHNMARPQCPYYAIVKEPEPQIKIFFVFVMPQRFCIFEYVLQKIFVQT